MENNKDNNKASRQQEPEILAPCIFCRFAVTKESSVYTTVVGTTLCPQKAEEMQQVWYLQSPMALGPSVSLCWVMGCTYSSLVASRAPIPYSWWTDIVVQLARCHMTHTLKQYQEVYCIPRTGEGFLLIRKKNLGPSESFHTRECSRLRH